jgi:hypothetical protein
VAGFLALSAKAQTTSINNIDSAQDTTISIKKGDSLGAIHRSYEFIEGKGDIEGEPNVLQKTARDNWKKACEDWKKELKELNKDNQVLVHNCNSPICKSETSGTICKSTGSYKLRVQIVK